MSSTEPPEASTPRIGSYQLLDTVGAGASGVVYRARHAETGGLVALKRARALDPGELGSLRREVHALGRMRHDGIVRIMDHGVSEGVPWYAMELLAGETLRQRLDRLAHPLSDAARAETLRLVERLCEALAFLHGEGIVHRDLKPENVFIDATRGPVLVDFGLALQVAGPRGRERLEPAAAGRGSLDYVAPEQLHGGTVDARADLYSLGCILYQILAGRPPFPGGHWSPSQPPPLGDEVPASLRQLVARLITFHARERLGHALDVAAVLAAARGASLGGTLPTRSYLYRPSFVGRAEALARITAALDGGSPPGRRQALWVGAPSGSGKTRLVTEAAALAAARGHRVIVAGCAPLATAQPLDALAPLMHAVVDHCRVAGRGETERIVGARGRILGARWPELGALAGQARYPEPAPLSGRAARDRLIDALVDTIVCFAAGTPLVLVLDDLQWADDMTLELLARLESDDECAVALVGTFRSDETTEALDRFIGDRRAVLRLAPLDGGAIASIIADMLALDAAPRELLDGVAAHAEGNPLFVAEYLRAAVAEELVRRDRLGHWRVAPASARNPVGALGVPLTLRELIGHRLARLGDGARRLVERAAVLGREFELSWLEHASPLGDGETLEAINELVVREVLESAPQGRMGFTHDKVREVAYAELGAATRRELHHAAAQTIEAQAASRRDLFAVLAHHYAIAEVDDKAIEYFERAGEHALALGAHRDAIALIEQALARDREGHPLVDVARRARWRQMLGEAAFALGDLRGCREHLGRVVAAFHAPLPDSRPRWVALLVVETVRQLFGLIAGRRRRRPANVAGLRAASMAAAKIAEAAYFAGDLLVVLSANLLAANLAERAGSEGEVPRAYAQLGYTAGFLRMPSLASRYFTRARATPAASVHYIEALYHLGFGRWAQAETAARAAIDLLAGAGDRQENEIAQTMLAQAEYFSGRFAAAWSRFLAVRDSAQARHNQQHRAWGCYGAARSLLALGRSDEAAPLLDQADALLQGQDDRASEIICDGLQALAADRRGDVAAARQRADRALARLRAGTPPVFSTVHGYDGALAVQRAAAARAGDDRSSLASARRTAKLLRAFSRSFPMARPTWLRHHAALLLADKKRRRARRAFDAAIAAAAALGMPFEEAQARLAYGQSGLLDGTAAHGQLAHAEAQLSALGCEYHLRVCQAERERVESKQRR